MITEINTVNHLPLSAKDSHHRIRLIRLKTLNQLMMVDVFVIMVNIL